MQPSDIIYLDHAAATPLDPLVEQAMRPFFREAFYNPSSPYAPAVEVRRALEDARHAIAMTIGASRDEIIFTAGATESIEIAMTVAGNERIITSPIEHPAVLENATTRPHTIVNVSREGLVDPAQIARAITSGTHLVSIALANHEIGTIQPLADIAKIVADVRSTRAKQGNPMPIWLHTDASQGVGQVAIHVARLGVDMMTLNAGKMYGPKQVGVLWRRPGVQIAPLFYGGGQEMGLRSGTENVAGAVGMAKAIELAESRRKKEYERLTGLRNTLETRLVDEFGDVIQVLGARKKRLAGHLSIVVPGIDAERLVFMLEREGVLVSTGSACAANKGSGSPVLRALGLSEQELMGSLRLTLGHLNNEQNIAQAAEKIIAVIRQERQRVGIC